MKRDNGAMFTWYNLDGSGAGIWVRDGILHVIDVTFEVEWL